MNTIQKIVACLVAAAGAALAPVQANAQVSRIGDTFAVWSDGGARGSDIAYDSKNNVYLAVSSFGTVRGRFISADGVPLGTAFVIQASPYLTHFPRVAYSPDAAGGAGAFLVTWHASVTAGGTDVYSRIVSYTAGLGTESWLMPSDSFWEAGPAVAYATGSKEFLVVWQSYLSDVHGVRVANTGVPIGTPFNVTPSGDGERDPNVAYNPATDEFMVVYSGWTSSFAFTRAQRVKAGTGALIGSPTPLTATTGTYITNVAYNPATGKYLAAWYQPGGHYGRLINADGSVQGDVMVLATNYAAYDALGLAYNPMSGTFHTISQGATAENGGVELNGSGWPLNTGTQITAIGGTLGNFYPRLATHTGRKEWTMVSAHEFQVTIAQRFGTGGATPPPPGTSCSYSLDSGGTTVGPTGGTGYLTLRANASNCSWSAGSNAAWLAPSAANGAGTVTLAYTFAPNLTFSNRSGVINIAGQGFTVVQKGLSAAVHDVNGDALSDILWQHQATGDLIAWYLDGSAVRGWNYLSMSVADTNWDVAGTGDLNGDGYADVVWQHKDGYLALWLLRGPTVVAFGNLSINPVNDKNWKIRAVGDLNGDGRADLIWRHSTTGNLVAWFMNGSSVVSWQYLSVPTISDLSWDIAGAGDINGDGKADIIWQHQANGNLVAWLMNGASVLSADYLSISAVTDLTWKVRGVGDTNGDGRADLIWQNTASGDLIVWMLNSYQVLSWSYLSIPSVPDTNWHVVGPG